MAHTQLRADERSRAVAGSPNAVAADLRCLQIGMWWHTDQAGGLDRVYANLIDRLPAAGVAVAGLVEGPLDVAGMTGGRVRCFAPDGTGLINRLFGVRRAASACVRDFKPHVIGCHFALYAAPLRGLRRRPPLVVHFHGPWSGEAAEEGASPRNVAVKRFLERQVYHEADRIVVLSSAFARLIIEDFGVPAARVRLVPGHVELARFAVDVSRSEAREMLGWPLDRPILVSVRRLSKRMGLDRLISAMPRLVAAVPDVLLYIAGRGSQAELLQQQAEAAGLQRHVRFLGFVPEDKLPLVYRAADINVVPTLALEGFGLVAAEALAAGTPSMVTPVGALPEVVGPLCTDLIFASATPDAIADGLIDALLGTTSLPDSTACRMYAVANFASVLAAQRTADLYRELA